MRNKHSNFSPWGVGGRAHTPLSPFPGGEWGRGVRAGAHTPLPGNLFIYSYIQFTQKSAAAAFLEYFYTQKSAAVPCFGEWGILKSLYSKERRSAVFLKMEYFPKLFFQKSAALWWLCRVLENEAFLNIYILKKVPHCHVLENRLGFLLCTYLTFLRVIRSEFKA